MNLIIFFSYFIILFFWNFLPAKIRLISVLSYAFFFLNYSDFSNHVFQATNLSGNIFDLSVYLNFLSNLCSVKDFKSGDLLFDGLGSATCFTSASIALKTIIIFNIFFQIFIINLLFTNSKLALLIYFGLGNFFWSNFNTVSFNLILTFFMAICLFRGNLGRWCVIPGLFLSRYGHFAIAPSVVVVESLFFKLKTYLILISLLFIFFIFFFDNVMAFLVSLDDRYERYIIMDGTSLPLWTIFTVGLFLFFYGKDFYKKSSSYKVFTFSLVLIGFLQLTDILFGIQNDIILRFANPLIFLVIYQIFSLLNQYFVNYLFYISLSVALATYQYFSITNTSNGWSFF